MIHEAEIGVEIHERIDNLDLVLYLWFISMNDNDIRMENLVGFNDRALTRYDFHLAMC